MTLDFKLFGPAHISILAAVPATGAALANWCRQSGRGARWIRYGLGSFMALNELIWYAYRLHGEGFRFPEGLPLNLCDLTLWLTIAALFTLHSWAFELAYFIGLAGSGMALLTPDLWAPFFSYPTPYFFLARTGRSSLPCSCWPGVSWLAAVGMFDVIFKTNYVYLCQKPARASLHLGMRGSRAGYLLGTLAAFPLKGSLARVIGDITRALAYYRAQ